MMGLTAKQAELLGFIEAEIARTGGVSPSFAEMKRAVGLQSNFGLQRLLKALEERGRLKRMARRARSLELASAPRSVTFHPVIRSNKQREAVVGPGRPVLISIDGGRQS